MAKALAANAGITWLCSGPWKRGCELLGIAGASELANGASERAAETPQSNGHAAEGQAFYGQLGSAQQLRAFVLPNHWGKTLLHQLQSQL